VRRVRGPGPGPAIPVPAATAREREGRGAQSVPDWAAIPIGGLGGLLTVALLVALGVGLGRAALGDADGSTRALAAFLWGGPALLLAGAAAGWLGARLGAVPSRTRAAFGGLISAALAGLLALWLVEATVGDATDFRSVGVEIGLVDPHGVPPVSQAELPLPPALAQRTVDPADLARQRARGATAYAAAVLLLVLGAGALGGAAGATRRRAGAPTPPPNAPPERGPHVDDLAWSRADGVMRSILPLAVACGLLSGVAAGAGVVPGDVLVARWVQRTPAEVAAPVAQFADWSGSLPGLVAAAMVLSAALALKQRHLAAQLVLAAVLARGLNPYLKEIFNSPRPTADLVQVSEQAAGLGFPSGHAMGVSLLFGAVAVLPGRFGVPSSARWAARAPAAAMLALTGFGRVYTGAHWPSDVLGGYLWGASILIALVRFLPLAHRAGWYRSDTARGSRSLLHSRPPEA
jgi:membrane-associated phospholipid phosphatase